ncbi:GntR family transcriptional regulator [Phycicoccus sp. BSK3Z-2]|uniref:GntR family transcriptional regulator n=1 Tax=Phycicoccus avicenniae TaxID=2828860 RepID=A0A941D5H7_9MICO|nr:GntR family transcriptional regulator [Phycicoccus avicenniae]MBR7741821.1 GntR family transcriptional regulator [Phycicoccus avicenniae]
MTDALERDSAVPLYQQLEEILVGKISAGVWAPGQRIPSENELNRTYGLSRMTVRGVLSKLTADGLLVRVPGKGTFVSSTKISAVSPAYKGIREQLEAQGYDTSTELLYLEMTDPSPRVREKLRLGAVDKVYAIVRLRKANGEPLSLHRSFIPAALAPALETHDVVGEQLCVVLEGHYGLPMKTVEESLEAVAVDTTEAKQLGLRRGDPALLLTDIISDRRGLAFEYSSIVFRGDTMQLKFDYQL